MTLLFLITLQAAPNSITRSDDDGIADETLTPDAMVDDVEWGIDGRELSADNDDMDEYSQNIYKVHIGKNVHCRAKKASNTIDVRHSFFRNMSTTSEHPTQRGIKLTKYEFTKLLKYLPQLEAKWKGLADLAACYTTHTTPDALQACHHCTPKPLPPKPLIIRSNTREPGAATSTTAIIDELPVIQ